MIFIVICISFLVFVAYLTYAMASCLKTGIGLPKSLWEAHNHIRWKNGRSAAYIVMCILAIEAIISMTGYFWWCKGFGILAAVCLIGFAYINYSNDESQVRAHSILECISAGATVIYIVLATDYWWVLPAALVVFLPFGLRSKRKNFRLMLELAGFSSFYAATILQLLMKSYIWF